MNYKDKSKESGQYKSYRQMIREGNITDPKLNRKLRNCRVTVTNVNDLGKGDGTYGSFLRSDYWKFVKKAVMDRDKNYCQLCGSRNHLIVHHLSYEHHGDEWNHKGELVTLCRGCHENVHKVEYINKELLHKLGFV